MAEWQALSPGLSWGSRPPPAPVPPRPWSAVGPWVYVDVAASLTDAGMRLGEHPTGVASLLMPVAGAVRAWSLRSSAARTAGTATIELQTGPTPADTGDTLVLDATTTNNAYAVLQTPRPFGAGEFLRAEITTDAGWTPITADFVVMLWVEYVTGTNP